MNGGFYGFLALIAWAASLSAGPLPCTTAPCEFSTNIAWNTTGAPMSGDGIWGNGASREDRIPFVDVPAGYRVQIVHVSGDEIAAPFTSPRGLAYALVGLTNSSPFESPYIAAGLGSKGCFLYKQAPIPAWGARIAINEHTLGVLNPDNVLIVKQALFLSNAGVIIHMEATLVIDFKYIPE